MIKLVARLLDQIYVVPSPQSPLRYDDTPPDPMSFTQTVNNTGNLTASAPMLPLYVLINPTQWAKIVYYDYACYFMFTCTIDYY